MTGPLLPEPTWRVAHPCSGEGHRIKPVSHAVRNGHTLCGHTERSVSWADLSPVDAPLCPLCNRVAEGHATTPDLLAFGMTFRQLDWWCRQGWIRADNPDPGSGKRRSFPPGEVEVAATMTALVKAGVSASAAHRAARNGGLLAPGVRVELAAAS